MKIVSNSTPLIALSRINELDLLRIIFGTIFAQAPYTMRWFQEDPGSQA